jgi:hypothetical protein
MRTRTYSELIRIDTFEERFRYLSLQGQVGVDTFGFDRYLNQTFYASREWKRIRQQVIARDEGCDMAVPGFEIYDRIYVHHMNPMTPEDIKHGNDDILNPEYLICVTHKTHNAIHYGDERQLPRQFVERRPGDTKLW